MTDEKLLRRINLNPELWQQDYHSRDAISVEMILSLHTFSCFED